MIENGIIKVDNIDGVPVIVDLIPVSNKYARPGNPMAPTTVTIHNTGNTNKDANGQMHTEYVDNVKDYVSWHFTVDDFAIYQELPVNENAWHAGDGGEGPGNRTSIAIEICEQPGINWEKAKENAVKLLYFLKQNITSLQADFIVSHQKWSGKYCPHRILDEGWQLFIDQYTRYAKSKEKPFADYKYEGLEWFKTQGLIQDYDGWHKLLDDSMPVWAVLVFIKRAFERKG
jgi:N-acetylmuramoyl-L-alanine amidase CwlA